MKPSPKSRSSVCPTRGLLLAGVLVLSACASPQHRAPVEERGVAARPTVPTPAPAAAPAPAPVAVTPPPPEPPRAVTYTVKPGDTMIRIGLDAGQNWRDIARWNGIENPNLLEVGQVLRVNPPPGEATRAVTNARPEAKPAEAGAEAAPASPTVAPALAEGELDWMWPAAGPVVAGFDEVRNKGLSIAGKAGDPVLAAADGRVVYAGSGLRGYGNLVIVKHNSLYLTAYAHNQTLLVKEDQVVRRGQKIAEMGSSDADRVKLHFEIRRQGKPVDPARLLPTR